jgi:hypothetical protein
VPLKQGNEESAIINVWDPASRSPNMFGGNPEHRLVMGEYVDGIRARVQPKTFFPQRISVPARFVALATKKPGRSVR